MFYLICLVVSKRTHLHMHAWQRRRHRTQDRPVSSRQRRPQGDYDISGQTQYFIRSGYESRREQVGGLDARTDRMSVSCREKWAWTWSVKCVGSHSVENSIMVVFIFDALGGNWSGNVTLCNRHIPTDYINFLCNYNICNVNIPLHVYETSFQPPEATENESDGSKLVWNI